MRVPNCYLFSDFGILTSSKANPKPVTFYVTLNNALFHRGDSCLATGNVSFNTLLQNGTNVVNPAPNVPLSFYIWNDFAFKDPVSGLLVPDVPLLNVTGSNETYTGSGNDTGNFKWAFFMRNLQAGRYFLKIAVDTVNTGSFTGETYVSFDLVEYTQLNATIIPNANVTLLQQGELLRQKRQFLCQRTRNNRHPTSRPR